MMHKVKYTQEERRVSITLDGNVSFEIDLAPVEALEWTAQMQSMDGVIDWTITMHEEAFIIDNGESTARLVGNQVFTFQNDVLEWKETAYLWSIKQLFSGERMVAQVDYGFMGWTNFDLDIYTDDLEYTALMVISAMIPSLYAQDETWEALRFYSEATKTMTTQ